MLANSAATSSCVSQECPLSTTGLWGTWSAKSWLNQRYTPPSLSLMQGFDVLVQSANLSAGLYCMTVYHLFMTCQQPINDWVIYQLAWLTKQGICMCISAPPQNSILCQESPLRMVLQKTRLLSFIYNQNVGNASCVARCAV